MVNRRNFIAGAAGCAGFMSIMRPLELMAIELPTPQRIFFINLFGGCDALSIFNPYGNAGLQAMRPTAWIPTQELADGNWRIQGNNSTAPWLQNYIAINPAMPFLRDLYNQGGVNAHLAVHSGLNSQSHFLMQDYLGRGEDMRNQATGFLARLINAMNNRADYRDVGGIAISSQSLVPMVLRGSLEVSSYMPSNLPMSPADIANMTVRMNSGDTAMISAINTGVATRNQTMNLINGQLTQNWFANTAIISHASVAGLMARLEGSTAPRVFGLVHDGFDSHVNQGRNAGRLGNLDNALRSLITTLRGDPNSPDEFLRADILQNSMIIVTSEFGRRVAQNASGGTDHGFGGMCMVIDGSRIGREQSQITTGLTNNGRGYYPHLTTEQYVQADDVVHNFMRPFVQRHYGFDTATMNYVLPVL
jgi:uncharacterized protein (DUF1501 family)